MSLLAVFAVCVLVAVCAKAAVWVVQCRTANAGMVDPVWACTLGAMALIVAVLGTAPVELRWLLGLMGGLWGLRLGTHLFLRNHGKTEDWRYARFRAQWASQADRNMFFFFQFQNLFTLALTLMAFFPVAFRESMPHPILVALAVSIWIVSVVGEGIADRQMEAFRANPANKGRTCRDGLWRFSRHPNYFFETLHWAAYVPLAVGAGAIGWISLGAPLLMAFLLMKMSGVPMLEAEMMQRKKGYAEYMRTTSALIPWPPKPADARARDAA